MKGHGRARYETGFTLIELLIVVLVIAILVGIAIPVFLSQRNKARIAAVQRSLKDASQAAEAYAVDNAGNYSGLATDGLAKLQANGFRSTAEVLLATNGDSSTYCLLAQNTLLDPSHLWHLATYEPIDGRATEADTCASIATPDPPMPPEEPEDLLEVPELPVPTPTVTVPAAVLTPIPTVPAVPTPPCVPPVC